MRSGVRVAHQAQCKCGWTGSCWFGPGARSSAWAEYRAHKQYAEAVSLPCTKKGAQLARAAEAENA